MKKRRLQYSLTIYQQSKTSKHDEVQRFLGRTGGLGIRIDAADGCVAGLRGRHLLQSLEGKDDQVPKKYGAYSVCAYAGLSRS